VKICCWKLKPSVPKRCGHRRPGSRARRTDSDLTPHVSLPHVSLQVLVFAMPPGGSGIKLGPKRDRWTAFNTLHRLSTYTRMAYRIFIARGKRFTFPPQWVMAVNRRASEVLIPGSATSRSAVFTSDSNPRGFAALIPSLPRRENVFADDPVSSASGF
jgi:hypothetical protein